jgi:hypothetical protein
MEPGENDDLVFFCWDIGDDRASNDLYMKHCNKQYFNKIILLLQPFGFSIRLGKRFNFSRTFFYHHPTYALHKKTPSKKVYSAPAPVATHVCFCPTTLYH